MASPLKRIFNLTIAFLLSVTSYALPSGRQEQLVTDSFTQPQKYVRVAIMQDTTFLRLKVKGFYEAVDVKNNKILYRGRNLNTTVTVYAGGILLGDVKSESSKVLIKPDDPQAALINGRMFRGDIHFIKNNNTGFSVINYIELEDYIKGILYHEASHYWPQEALKAQAIVCRTYAVYQMQENKNKDFDVTSDIYSQVYGGRTSERYRTNKAVDETKDEILAYQGKVFPAYFHATCAGHTEDASMLWNINIPPLKGVPCGFCKDSPHFNWHYVLSLDELGDKLAKAGYKINNIEDIVILGRDDSGRITDLKLISIKKEIKISAKDFRNIMGPNFIRSANFKVDIIKNDAVFEGFGWGHGVGLCQWGAYFMAKQGYNTAEILKYYYPGSDVKLIGF
jgi:stage II sporulation protein D